MDPISVSASIFGLLGAATKISEVLTSFVRGMKDAPRLAQRTLTEVEDLRLCFHQLQDWVNLEGSRTERKSRAAMIMVDQLVVILTHSILTFSELESAVAGLKPRSSFIMNSRFKWMAKEHTITLLLQRLQASKASLNLLITTLTCTGVEEAQEAMRSLTDVVNNVLDTNQRICRHLENANISIEHKHRSAPSALENKIPERPASTEKTRPETWTSTTPTAVDVSSGYDSSFEKDLRASRVYSRSSKTLNRRSDPDNFSLLSSTSRSVGSSFLSGLSLAEVSNISLISFPSPIQTMIEKPRCEMPPVLRSLNFDSGKTLPRLPGLFPKLPASNGKIALLGISNAGKSTILKQLHSIEGTGPTRAELNNASKMIYTQLVEVFRRVSERSVDPQTDMLSKCQIISHSSIMDKVEKILWPDDPNDPFDARLYVHIKTIGLYKSNIRVKPFEYEIIDVGGTRSVRKKWLRCLEGLDHVIYVADLNGYCQNLEEDPNMNQMLESLHVFEGITRSPHVQNIPVFLFLNKADLFEKTIVNHPISNVFPDYIGGVDYWKACRYMADLFNRHDQRPPGKLHCYVVDSLDTAAFQNAWRQVQEKIIYTTLKY
ncbi:MAG: hypothetical protein Q9223_004040 [Gallowayella weberi]